MLPEKKFKYYTTTVIIVGALTFLAALFQVNSRMFNWQFILLAVFTITVASRMHLLIPRVKVVLTFSDTMVFLAFIMFGGVEAIFVSTFEMLSTCYILKRQGYIFRPHSIPFTVSSAVLTVASSWLVLEFFYVLTSRPADFVNSKDLFTTLGVLAVSQFIVNSSFSAYYTASRDGESFFESWKKGRLSISITQITGASLAAIIYKTVYFGDFWTSLIALTVLVIIYFSFRKVLAEMRLSVTEAEEAQKEKAEAEKLRAEQAEKHAAELSLSLAEQEIISKKLKESYEALESAAYYDSLTKLPNRAYLIERLSLLFDLKIDISNNYYVLFIDLKKFKNINNRLGHATGDKIILLVSKRLQRLVKQEDTVVRLDGNRFALVLTDIESADAAINFAKRIHKKIIQPFSFHGHKIFLDAYIGISPFDEEHKSPEDILRDADIALHHAKEKNQDLAAFDKNLRLQALETVKTETLLRSALEKNEISMYYQPLISLQTGEIAGFEALMRWHSEQLGFVSPAKFIPIAEASGLIIPLTEWLLKETTLQLARWQKISPHYQNLMLSVNISGKHILYDDLVQSVREAVVNSDINPNSLKLEITESTAMEDIERTVTVLKELKNLGSQLSIDDFGTGYSSLNCLHLLPFDTLKIDRSFIRDIGENGENSEILQTIISLAANLKMKVVAEGIETEAQLRLLKNLGCHFGQGFLMAKPMPKEQMEDLLYQKNLWFPETFSDSEFAQERYYPSLPETISNRIN